MTLQRFMRRLPGFLGLAGILSASVSGCGGGGGVVGGTSGNPGAPPAGGNPNGDFNGRAACVANPDRPGLPRWTVLVFMNAANDLQPDSLTNMAQMASVGSDEHVNIVVQWKQARCAGCGIPSFEGTRRYFVRRKTSEEVARIRRGDTTPLDPDRLPDPPTNIGGTSDMGDWRVLRDFIQWGTQNYPADHLAVVLWNHGSGWRRTRTRAFSQDEQTGNEIQTEETPQALAVAAQPIDVLLFDCSLMQMVEVAYELRNSARVLVGSQESPPAAGYPYDVWLNSLKANGRNPCELGRSVVQDFVAAYPNNTNITQSMVDLSKMDLLASRLSEFAGLLRQNIATEAEVIRTARVQAHSFDYYENKDLFDYAELIRSQTRVDSLRQAAYNLQVALTGPGGAIMMSRGGRTQNRANGLAVYVPAPGGYLQSYNNLALARATLWDEFLQAQIQ
ncbi:MAG: clostripain-related cysteine peptidase [Chloroherpetonaceae bacterium]|nr:clostripain-related cysteine peptidase [Chthonomonadaceae bacterium]MDW8208331.1 clostripain-related cysteine peptidase [Chloroherpetonaceae bacterium]